MLLLLLVMLLWLMMVMRLELLDRRVVSGLGRSMARHVLLLLLMLMVLMVLLVVLLLLLVVVLSASVRVVVLLLLHRMSLRVRSAHAGILVEVVMAVAAAVALVKPANQRHGRRAATAG